MQRQQQTYGYRQFLFVRYVSATLIDLVVLGFFVQYWDAVDITSFSYLFLAAIALQIMLKAAISVEHYSAQYIDKKEFKNAKRIQIINAWGILLASKLLILGAMSLLFKHNVEFHGLWHGVIPFLIVVFSMLGAEAIVHRIYLWLGKKDLQELDNE